MVPLGRSVAAIATAQIAGAELQDAELQELEDLYTTGCAEVLELEADSMRIRRRLQDLRDQLRHIRTAIEFLQEEQAAGRAAQ